MNMNKHIKFNLLRIKNLFYIFFIFFLKYIFFLLIAFFLFIPFYWMFNISFQNASINPNWYPQNFTSENFSKFWFYGKDIFLFCFFKTVIVVFVSTILGTIFTIITAFALSILEFKTKKIIFGVFLATTMITTESMFLTNYQIVAGLGLVNAGQGSAVPGGVYLAIILPFLINVFHIFLLMQNIKKIPKELYLAAKVDGSSDLKFLYKILTPLLKTNIINIIIFRAVAAWNSYLWPELVGGKLLTNQIRNFFDSETKQNLVNQQMAATVLITLPLVLLFIFCKRYVLEGRVNSGIKG